VSLIIIVFISTILLCCFSYFLYPLIIFIYGFFFKLVVEKGDIKNKISIIISAYNEEINIEKKILNTLDLDYPKGQIEILIGSDGSTDNTGDIANKYIDLGVKFFHFNINRGKTAVQNDLVKNSTGEILVFTDAASYLPQNALKCLLSNFADERIGCVAGKMQFVDTDINLTTQSQGLYWRYEVAIREMESNLGSLIGVDGPLYAVRRKNYIELEHNIISDLITPLLVLEQGKKVILEPEAIVKEDPTIKTGDEFRTRRRITLRGLIGVFSHKNILNPFKHPVLSIQIVLHKLLRWFVGPLVLLNGLASIILAFKYMFFKVYMMVYLLFFILAGLGWLTEKLNIKIRILAIPYYFTLVNLAATMGIVDFFKKKQAVSWTPVRH